MSSSLEQEAISWIKGREVTYLRRRVFQALRTAIESGSSHEWGYYDPEAWAEELQLYSSDLESVSVEALALLIEEYQEEIEQ